MRENVNTQLRRSLQFLLGFYRRKQPRSPVEQVRVMRIHRFVFEKGIHLFRLMLHKWSRPLLHHRNPEDPCSDFASVEMAPGGNIDGGEFLSSLDDFSGQLLRTFIWMTWYEMIFSIGKYVSWSSPKGLDDVRNYGQDSSSFSIWFRSERIGRLEFEIEFNHLCEGWFLFDEFSTDDWDRFYFIQTKCTQPTNFFVISPFFSDIIPRH